MSGDSLYVEFVDLPIDINRLMPMVGDPDVGAIGWFFGVTRRTTRDRVTTTLSYDAHRTMAQRELRELAVAAMKRFNLTKIVVVHRLGVVPIGDASVVVGCSSPHRRDTFDALPWMMDELKRQVPIWKRENYADGTEEWIHPAPSGS